MKTLEVLEKVVRGKRISANTERNYRRALGLLAEYSEEWPGESAVVNEWIASLDGFADRTVKLFYIMGKSAGCYMKRVWKLDNPFEGSEAPVVKKQQRRYFTTDEMVRIIRACADDSERLLIATLIDSTCRIGELAGITGDAVGNGYVLLSGKTGQRRYRLNEAFCVQMRKVAPGDSPVFRDVRQPDRSASVSGLSQRVRRIIVRAGVKGKKLGAHTLRHTSASMVASETGSALMVKAILQHDDIKTSMEYIHDVEDKLQQEVSPLELLHRQAFGEGGKGDEAKQLGLGESVSSDMVNDLAVIDADGSELELAMYPKIPGNIAVRPMLRTEDLRLIREIMLRYSRLDSADAVNLRGRELMRRMLRKVK